MIERNRYTESVEPDADEELTPDVVDLINNVGQALVDGFELLREDDPADCEFDDYEG